MPSDCWWGTTHGQSASCHEPPGILHTWDSWSVTPSATNPSTPTGTKWRTWMQLSLIRNALGVEESSWVKLVTAWKHCLPFTSLRRVLQPSGWGVASAGSTGWLHPLCLWGGRMADSNPMRKGGGHCFHYSVCSGGCLGLKEPELGQGVLVEVDEPPLLSYAKPFIGHFLKGLWTGE